MAVTSGFFNAVNSDRLYNAAQMSEYFRGILSDGVAQNYGGGLQVQASSTPDMNVKVQTGRAYIDSRWMEVDAVETLAITAAHVTLNRYTAVVVKLDMTNRQMTLATVDGTAATNPTKPTPADSETVKYLVLAYVYVAAGATAIAQAQISDTRAQTDICGYVSGLVDQVDTTNLFLQWQDAYATYYANMSAQFNAWFDTLTSQLNVITYVEDYHKVVTLAGATTAIPLNMAGYAYDESDVVQVHINGLLAQAGTDYTLSVSGTSATVTPVATASGTVVDILVLKSRIGFQVLGTSDGGVVVTSNNEIIST